MRVDEQSRARDRGQTTPIAAAMVALVAAALVALVPAARALAERAQARTAADAAALAGAAEGEQAARDVADGNGGDLLAFERDGDEVVVRVRVGDVDAYARARATRRAPPAEPAGSTPRGGDRAGLSPAMLAALARADGLLGHPVRVISGLRSRAAQEALWRRRATNAYPVAPPGTSDHERGLAVDVARADVAGLAAVADTAGLCRPLPDTDPVHFVVCGT
jgi:D-alanyl-D-alanine carboxypeptidase/Putative Flp pilus-assembly TadE/G-like